MTKKEVAGLLQLINIAYPWVTVDKEKLDVWHEMLADQDADKVTAKAKTHIKSQSRPPTIAELVTVNQHVEYFDTSIYD